MNPPSAAPRHELVLVALLSGFILLGFVALAAPVYRFTGDTSAYVALARALAAGESYAIDGRPETMFPPGLPSLLAPAAWIFPESFAAVSRWAAALGALVFPMTWLFVRQRHPGWALPIALLVTFSAAYLTLVTDNPMAEPTYLVVSLGLLVLMEKAELAPRESRSLGWVLATTVLLVAVPAMRSIGIAAQVAYGCWIGIHRRWRRLQYLLPLVAAVGFQVAWFVWPRAGEAPSSDAGGGYLSTVLIKDAHEPDLGRATAIDLVRRIASNIVAQAAHLGEMIIPIADVQPVWFSPVMLLVPVLALGWWCSLGVRSAYAQLYFFCYVGLVLGWPYDEGVRFLLPVLPLVWIYLVTGTRRLVAAVVEGPRTLRTIGLAWCGISLVGAVLVMAKRPAASASKQELAAVGIWLLSGGALLFGWTHMVRLVRQIRQRNSRPVLLCAGVTLVAVSLAVALPPVIARARGAMPEEGNTRSLAEASAWIRAHTVPNAVIETGYPSRMRFATGRRTIQFPVTSDAGIHLEVERRHHPDYLIVMESDDPYYTPLEKERFKLLSALLPGRWHPVHHFYEGTIYAAR